MWSQTPPVTTDPNLLRITRSCLSAAAPAASFWSPSVSSSDQNTLESPLRMTNEPRGFGSVKLVDAESSEGSISSFPSGTSQCHQARSSRTTSAPKNNRASYALCAAATQLDVLFRRRATHGIGLHVVELQERARTAAFFGPDKRAATVTSPHGAAHRCRDVARGLRAGFRRAPIFGRRARLSAHRIHAARTPRMLRQLVLVWNEQCRRQGRRRGVTPKANRSTLRRDTRQLSLSMLGHNQPVVPICAIAFFIALSLTSLTWVMTDHSLPKGSSNRALRSP